MKHKNCSGEFAIHKIHEYPHANYQERLCTTCHARIYVSDSEAAAIMDIEELNEVIGKLEMFRSEERLDAIGSKKLIDYRRMRELRVNIIYIPVVESGHSNIAASGHGSGFPSDDAGYEDPEDFDDYWDD